MTAKVHKTKRDKKDIRKDTRLTRPPRLEGVVKEAMMQPTRKSKNTKAKPSRSGKAQGLSERQRKDYQLGSRRH